VNWYANVLQCNVSLACLCVESLSLDTCQHTCILAGDLAALGIVENLDASNDHQLQVLHTYFSHNMATVDFWLNSCVLPAEMKQYPFKLARSAGHLADNRDGRIVGFSGELH